MKTKGKLPKAFKKKWLEALRSGKFKQGQNSLYNKDKDNYCCLGVACKVAYKRAPEWLRGCNWIPETSKNVPSVLTGDSIGNDIALKLAKMNDTGKKFKTIANWIEKNL